MCILDSTHKEESEIEQKMLVMTEIFLWAWHFVDNYIFLLISNTSSTFPSFYRNENLELVSNKKSYHDQIIAMQ